eukprot:COSAG01_NODE_37972_length_496_cov_1.062972_1_plen_93_part_10
MASSVNHSTLSGLSNRPALNRGISVRRADWVTRASVVRPRRVALSRPCKKLMLPISGRCIHRNTAPQQEAATPQQTVHAASAPTCAAGRPRVR